MENKKNKILSAIGITALAILIIGATYAYFASQGDETKNVNVKVSTNTVDTLTFQNGSDINITADQDSFAKDKGNRTGSSFLQATLRANNKTNIASMNYYAYLLIDDNDFVYTIDENTPELILSVTDSTGANISIDGLTQETVTDAKGSQIVGYDITNSKGLITLFNNKTIEVTTSDTDNTKIERWNIKITFVNYSEDQSKNAGKNINAKLIIQKELLPTTVADVCSSGDNLSSCVKTLSNKSYSTLTYIYHHDGTLENGLDDDSYRYAGGDYELTSLGKDIGATSIVTTNTDKSGLIETYCNAYSNSKVEYTYEYCSIDLNYMIKNDTIMYTTYKEAFDKALEKKYIEKNQINNFVCFAYDSTDGTCPDDNLYRIVGIFGNQVKLIKYNYAKSSLLGTDGDYADEISNAGWNSISEIGRYYWNMNNANKKAEGDWGSSYLNQINLNTNYINNIGSDWESIIATTTWKVGGDQPLFINGYGLKKGYEYELGKYSKDKTYSAKIGLLYVSDYGFAISPDKWTQNMASGYLNWIPMGENEFTVTPNTLTDYGHYGTPRAGGYGGGSGGTKAPIRPMFYLKSNIQYSSGIGTKESPIILVK